MPLSKYVLFILSPGLLIKKVGRDVRDREFVLFIVLFNFFFIYVVYFIMCRAPGRNSAVCITAPRAPPNDVRGEWAFLNCTRSGLVPVWMALAAYSLSADRV